MTDDSSVIGPQQILEDTKEFWRELGKTLVQGSISAIEESAKQIVSVNGVLIGFYSATIALSEMRKLHPQLWQLALFLSPILLWLLSLMTALTIFWTSSFKINLESSLGAKSIVEKLLRHKHNSLRFSFVFLFIGIILLIIALAIYVSDR